MANLMDHLQIQRRIPTAPHVLRRFPDEILAEVFHDVVRDDFYENSTPLNAGHGGDEPLQPWSLAVVCRRWRAVCLHNPRLWSYISFSWHNCEKPRNSSAVLRTFLQIERSQPMPLDVDASISGSCKCKCAFSALRIVSEQCRRWRSVTFNAESVDSDYMARSYLRNADYTQLQSIVWLCPTAEGTALTLPFDFDTTVNLQSATLVLFSSPENEPDFPWSQLTTLFLENPLLLCSELLTLFSQCAKLQHFRMRDALIRRDDENVTFQKDSIILSNLLSLEIYEYSGDPERASEYPRMFIPYLRLPKLRKLTYGPIDRTHSVQLLCDLIDRSSCSLTALETHHVPLFSELDGRLLQRMPKLESLTIREFLQIDPYESHVDCEDILEKLILSIEDPPSNILPGLKHLKLHRFTFDPVLLLQVVESRRKPRGALETLRVELSEYVPEEQRAYMKRVLQERLCTLDGFEAYLTNEL